MSASKPTGFVAELESLRFVAAFCVAYAHSWAYLSQGVNRAHLDPLMFQIFDQGYTLFNGQAAVDLFYVLSGFVLGRALDRHDGMSPRGWLVFMWRRFWRILPTHWFTLIAATGYVALVIAPWAPMVPRPDHTDAMIFESFPVRLSWDLIFRNATLAMNWFNPQAWSLQVELLAAILLPAMHDVARRYGWAMHVAVLSGFFWASALLEPRAPSALLFTQFLPAFYLGLIAQTQGATVASWLLRIFRLPDVALAVCWCVLMWPSRLLNFDDTLWNDVSMIGAFLLVSAMVWAPRGVLGRFLLTPVMRHCGRLSFAFYLWHFVVLRATYRIICATMPMPMLQEHLVAIFITVLAATVILALMLGEATHRLVELPGITLGRNLAEIWGRAQARRRGAAANAGF